MTMASTSATARVSTSAAMLLMWVSLPCYAAPGAASPPVGSAGPAATATIPKPSEQPAQLGATGSEPGHASPSNSTPGTEKPVPGLPLPPPEQKPPPSLFTYIFDQITSDNRIKELITGILTAILGAVLIWGRKRLRVLTKKLSDFKQGPRSLPQGTRKNTVLLVGIGRSGKSNLRLRILEKHKLGQPELTQRFDILSATIEANGGPRTTLTMCDYRGQSFLQLIRSFIEAQFMPETPLRYRDIESLILVVDLFPFQGTYRIPEQTWHAIRRRYPPSFEALEKAQPRQQDGLFCIDAIDFPMDEVDADLGSELQQFVKPSDPTDPQIDWPDSKHLREQVGLWNEAALDAIFALIPTPPLNFVCLFVNKLDKWKYGGSAENIKKYIHEGELRPLIESLSTRCKNHKSHHIEFIVIPGSAKSGNLGLLESLLVQYARPLSGQISALQPSIQQPQPRRSKSQDGMST